MLNVRYMQSQVCVWNWMKSVKIFHYRRMHLMCVLFVSAQKREFGQKRMGIEVWKICKDIAWEKKTLTTATTAASSHAHPMVIARICEWCVFVKWVMLNWKLWQHMYYIRDVRPIERPIMPNFLYERQERYDHIASGNLPRDIFKLTIWRKMPFSRRPKELPPFSWEFQFNSAYFWRR